MSSKRESCGGAIQLPTLFGCSQQFNGDFNAVKIKRNVTMMQAYASPYDWIDPYPLAEQISSPDCSPYNAGAPDYFVCGDGVNDKLWCYPSLTQSMFKPCPTGSFPVGNYTNCFSQSSETSSQFQCRNLGHKEVYANKLWQGARSFTWNGYGAWDSFDWCCNNCGWQGLQTGSAAVDNTKYLTKDGDSHFNVHTDFYDVEYVNQGTQFCCDESGFCECGTPGCGETNEVVCFTSTFTHDTDVGGSADALTSVDRFGNTTVATCNSSSHGCLGDEFCEAFRANMAMAMIGGATNPTALLAEYCSTLEDLVIASGQPDVIEGSRNSYHLEWHTDVELCMSACGIPGATTSELLYSMDITGTSFDLYTYGLQFRRSGCNNDDAICSTWIQTSHKHIQYTTTDYSLTEDITGIGSYSLNQQYHGEVAESFSDPYTSDEVNTDLNSLLGTWNFGDDRVYPWKDALDVNTGPLVSIDEGMAAPSIPLCITSSLYTGKIFGEPGPEGIDKIWDPTHKNYCTCESTIQPGCYAFYIKDWGAWSTDCGAPRATQWLNSYESNNIPQGAFLGSNQFWTFPDTCNSAGPQKYMDDRLWACKYAEVIFPKQSFNYIRPCGLDRLQISSSTNRCIVSITDDVVALEPTATPFIQFTNVDKLWICGTTDYDGMWSGNRDSDYQITLNEPRIASASQFPTVPYTNCGTGMIATLRYPNTRQALCGPVNIDGVTSGSNGSKITCSIDAQTYLVTGDTVKVSDALGASINGIHIITVIDSGVITPYIVLDDVVGPLSPYLGSGIMYSEFAPDPMWNDIEPKNDFTYRTWLFDYRTTGEYYRVFNLIAWNEGLPNCAGDGNCTNIPPTPYHYRGHQGECGLDENIKDMRCTTTCIESNPCSPVVGYFSPNVESFAASKNLTWPSFSDVGIDSIYGSMWQGIVYQSMPDPYFQIPPCPCEHVVDIDLGIDEFYCNGSWVEDTGECLNDQLIPPIKYFAARDQFEARCEVPTVPAGAPTMMPGVYIGCLSSSAYGIGAPQGNTNGCPKGNVCGAPYAYSTFDEETNCLSLKTVVYDSPWYTLRLKENCSCIGGRFADVYEANGIGVSPTCPAFVPPP